MKIEDKKEERLSIEDKKGEILRIEDKKEEKIEKIKIEEIKDESSAVVKTIPIVTTSYSYSPYGKLIKSF